MTTRWHYLLAVLLSVATSTALVAQSPLRIVTPNGGEDLKIGTTYTIEWSGVGSSTPVAIEYSTDAGESWATITSTVSKNRHNWAVADSPSDRCLLRMTTLDHGGQATPERILDGHDGWINSSHYSPDGQLAVTCGDENTAVIWNTSTGAQVTRLLGHSNDIMWAHFSPDGSRLATSSMDGTVKIWNTNTWQLIRTIGAHTASSSGASNCEFSPDGTLLVSSGYRTAKLWNVATGALVRTFDGHTDWTGVSFSPDGESIVTASRDGDMKIWDVSTGSVVRTFTDAHGTSPVYGFVGINVAMYSPDGTRIVSAGRDHIARVWDAQTGERLFDLLGNLDMVWHASYSPDGSRIAAAGRDGSLRIYDASTGEMQHSIHAHNADIGAAWFNPDGTRVLTSANDELGKIWRVASLGAPSNQTDRSDGLWSIARPGLRIVQPNGGEELKVGTTYDVRWEGRMSGEELRLEYSTDAGETWQMISDTITAAGYSWQVPIIPTTHNCLMRVTSMSVPPNGTPGEGEQDVSDDLWTIYAPEFRVVEPNGGERFPAGNTAVIRWVDQPEDARIRLSYTTDDGRSWVGIQDNLGGNQYLWTVPNTPSEHCRVRASVIGEGTGPTPEHVLSRHTGFVNSAHYSPDGLLAVTCSDDNTAIIWDAKTGEYMRTLGGHEHDVMWAHFSPNGAMLATASLDGTVKIWSTAGWQLLRTILTDEPRSPDSLGTSMCFFSPDSRTIVTSGFANAKIWNVATGERVHLIEGHSDWVGASFSPNGEFVVTASHDGNIRTWFTETGTLALSIDNAHGRSPNQKFFGANQAMFSPDGRSIVSAGRDNIARVWDAFTGEIKLELLGHTNMIWHASYSPDGTMIATAGRDGTVHVYDAATGSTLYNFNAHQGDVGAAWFNPDATELLTGANDRLGKIWSVASLSDKGALLSDVSDNVFAIDRSADVPVAGMNTAASVSAAALPNPVDHTLRLVINNSTTQTVDISIRNVLGKTVVPAFSHTLSAGRHELPTDVSHLASGAYFVTVRSGEFSTVVPIRIER